MERKEAIEIIKKNWPDSSFTILREALETVIPELSETEDEKIRKALIDYFRWNPDGQLLDEFSNRKVFAWLEKQAEQESAWSEEDEQNYETILKIICSSNKSESLVNKLLDWFKSFKGRVQSKQDWSEEDEEEANYIADFIENILKKEKLVSKKTMTMEEMVAWLRDIKHRYILKPEQGWSEEDEVLLRTAKDIIFKSDDCSDGTSCKVVYWLNSLKDRYTWKPSEEQMKFLWKYAEQNNYDGSILTSLYNDLKKLMEE